MKCKVVSLLLFINLAGSLSSQDFRVYLQEGDRQFDAGNYYGAAWMYKKAMNSDASLYDVIYKYADASRLNNEYAEAEKYYLKIIGENKDRFPLALFWMADVQKSLGQYQKARKNFEEYIKLHEPENDFFVKKAKHELLSCEKALELKFSPLDISIFHLDTSVNTVNGEFGVSVIADSVMFYSSLVPVKSGKDTNQLCAKIFVAKIENDTLFKSGRLLEPTINSLGYNVTNPSYSVKHQALYFSKSPMDPKAGKSQIYRSKLKNGHWTEAERLPDLINAKGMFTSQPFYTATKTGDVLLFVSDRNGGNGGLDIWFAPVDSSGSFSRVVNLGMRVDIDTSLAYLVDTKSKINSMDDEISPFYDSSDSTLYFSSKWHYGMGGFDIFKAKGDFIRWEGPVNLGNPVNTSWNDVYYNIDSKGEHVFFTSNRRGSLSKGKESCCNDIWYYTLPEKKKLDTIPLAEKKKEDEKRFVKVFEKEIKLLVPLTLYFDNDYPNPKTTDTVTKSNYEFLFEQYIAKEEEFRNKFSKGLTQVQAVKAVEEVDNFFYDDVQKGYDALIEFTQLMEELLSKNQVIVVTMKGYCSPLNTFDYNKNLAKRRISSLMNYFTEYKGGLFKKFIDNNQLVLEQVPVGKLTNSNVSEDIKDLRNSVFSPAASLERKIQIIAVQLNK